MIDGKLHCLPLNLFVLPFLTPCSLDSIERWFSIGQEVSRFYANNKEMRLQIWDDYRFAEIFLHLLTTFSN